MYLPIGTETLTNLPFSRLSVTLGTKFPSKMPMTMARKIQTARNRSSHPRDLKADTFFSTRACVSASWVCFSSSLGGSPCANFGSVTGGVAPVSLMSAILNWMIEAEAVGWNPHKQTS